MGSPDKIFNKLTSFSHQEFNNDDVVNNINMLDSIIDRRVDHLRQDRPKYDIVKLDDYFPSYILDNTEKYKDYIIPTTNDCKSIQHYYPFDICQVLK